MQLTNIIHTLFICTMCIWHHTFAMKVKYADYTTVKLTNIHKKITVLEGNTPTQWRITIKSNPATTATVSWSTQAIGKQSILYYGKQSSAGNLKGYSQQQICQRNGKYTGKIGKNKASYYYHHARLNNLAPNTRYYFTMVSAGKASKEFHFRTADANPKKLTLIHGGDSRSGIANRSRMNYLISKLAVKHPNIYAIVHGGDYVVDGKNLHQWRNWLSQNELITTSNNRVIPIIIAKGNHDKGKLIDEVFDFTSTKKNNKPCYYYAIQFGNYLSLITLDTNIAATGLQEKFLQTSLAKLRPQSIWLLTQYHRPLYPAVKRTTRHKKVFVPLFEKYNVDLALESDGHVIKRTVPIRNDKKDSTGVVYIGEGGLGVGQRQPKKNRWYIDPKNGGFAGNGHHIMLLTANKKQLNIKVICLNGKVVDNHTLKARQ